MTAESTSGVESLSFSLSVARQIDQECDRFEAEFRAGRAPRIESSLEAWTGDGAARTALFQALLELELELRRERGEQPAAHEYTERFAGHSRLIADAFAEAPTQSTIDDGDPESKPRPDPSSTEPEPTSDLASQAPTGTWVSVEDAPRAGGRFRVVRYYRGGGLGDIYLADDLELDRQVALKEIKPTLADMPEKRARFVFEAEVNGGLEHPSIVPVYGRGQYDNGRPYYAMRLIRGDTLQEAILRFHAADTKDRHRDPGERALALRELLGRFLDICDAIGYAHHRGILHRDLKPGNVLLGRFGETLVGDWGLARLIDCATTTAPAPAPAPAEPEPPLRPASAGDKGQTLSGRSVGTIGFMSPEQAEGRLDQLGPASDVYSLGAILYMLLTGRPSIRPGTRYVLAIAEIVNGAFPGLRAVNPRVDPALEAVCLKAMNTAPADRYSAPHALADEIKHWLADEPVAAYPEPWHRRLTRWARRHRAWVTAAAAALLLTALVASAAAVIVDRAYRAEQKARRQSEIAFNTIRRGAIETYQVATNNPASLINDESVRERLARYAAEAYDGLLRSGQGDRKMRLEAARADHQTASLRRLLGRYFEAKTSDDRALARFRDLVAEAPGDRESRDALSLCLGDLGALLRTMGRADQALTVLGEALDRARSLRAEAPDDLRYMRTEATALISLAATEIDVGHYDAAQRSSEQAYQLWSWLAASPRAKLLIDELSAIRSQLLLGTALRGRNDPSGARKAYEQALAAAEERANKYSKNSDTLAQLAAVRSNLGDLLLDTEPPRAEALFLGSVEHLKDVVRNRPLVPAFRLSLAVAYKGLSSAQLAAGHLESVDSPCAEAHTLLAALLKERDIPDYRCCLAQTLATQARIARAQGNHVKARDLYTQAIREHERALAVNRQSAADIKHQQRCREERQALEDRPNAQPPAAIQTPQTRR
jgi:serine/threonine-protein kinase